jgi:hypothetical protein
MFEQRVQEAADKLHDDIISGKVKWDENGTGYRWEMFISFEAIMFSELSWDEKKFALQDTMDDCLTAYCKNEVTNNPDYYFEYYEV